MRVTASLPTGVSALFFGAARRRRELEARLATELEAGGFAEVVLPVVDFHEPYEGLLSASARAELYRFTDRDGELLSLRSDFTPMLARLLAPRLPGLELPLRLFYRGDVVRYEESRLGRERELYQLGVEIVGAAAGQAEGAGEREALRLFLRLLAAAGIARPHLVLGFAGALDALLLAGEADPLELARGVARRERGVARRGGAELLAIVERGVPDDTAVLGAAAADLARLLALRDELAVAYPAAQVEIDLAEFALCTLDARLLAARDRRSYYDGLVFRAYAGPAASPVGGGGRYDGLFAALGAAAPALGFSLGLDGLSRLAESIAEEI
ncbi:MAG: ATP phosphoribosyltransferase regulatory subunit [Holophagales bacterium]|nr:MAG: ATP phosphoribosyltransferase regulatory subunit [Holophagales bacterium]